MKNRKLALIIPILVLITIACTCNVPVLQNLLATDTPLPTSTPPPTATLPPTETPIPTAIPPTDIPAQPATEEASATSDEVYVIKDNSFSADDWNYIVGLVYNNTSYPIEWVEMSVLIYDEGNNLIATEAVYPYLNVILPGTYVPFGINSDQWKDLSTYDFLIENWSIPKVWPGTGLEITNHRSYSPDDWLTVVGEIVNNNSDRAMSGVVVAVGLYAEDDTLLNTTYTAVMLDYLAPGGKAPFKTLFFENWQDSSYYEIQVQGFYDTLPHQTLQLVESEIEIEEGICTVKGSVRNLGAEDISYATVVISIYDVEGNLLDTEWGFTEGDNLAANATGTFTVSSYYCEGVDHYEVYLEE